MTINQSGWRPTAPEASAEVPATFTGNRALMLEEALIFEIGDPQSTGVDIEPSCSPAKAGAQASLWTPACAGEQPGCEIEKRSEALATS
jgi:glycine dehydrogenase subunit 2